MGTLYIVEDLQGADVTWTTYIPALKKSSWLMVTRIWKWNWRVFVIPGWGDFNDEKALKGLICVGGGDLNDENL